MSAHEDTDIQNALNQVATGSAEAEESTPADCQPDGTMVMAKACPVSCLTGGMKRAWSAAKAHPWWAALGLGASIACAQFLCVYFGTMMLGGLIIWGMKLPPKS